MAEKIVDYTKCSTCKYLETDETEDPCNECLNNPFNDDSRIPVNYSEDKSKT